MNDSFCNGFCPFSQFSWLWYWVAVIVVFLVGWLWYSKLFKQRWIKAVEYKCTCGADLSKGETCTCKKHTMLPMVIQIVATMLVGLMYFGLTQISIWLSLIVAVAISAWMKATLKFEVANWKRFVSLATIDVGYFFLASLLFMLFASL